MKLKEFLADFQAKRGPHDLMQIYHQGRNGIISTINLDNATEEARQMLMEADLEKAEVKETEYCDPFQTGRGGKCKAWAARLDNDQAMIALGIHPLLTKYNQKAKNAKPAVEGKKRGKGRRFTL